MLTRRKRRLQKPAYQNPLIEKKSTAALYNLTDRENEE